jgi:aminoglycoside phosphotransferase (APT) family kinase protein
MGEPLPVVPRRVEDLTPAWFGAALGVSVADVELRSFGEGVGMLSVMVHARIRSEHPGEGPASVVVKLPPWRDKNHGMGTEFGYFLREAEIYRRFGSGLPAPVCHHVAVDHDARLAVLVLADHTDARPADQIVGADDADAAAIVDAMAAMHARWWDHPALAADVTPAVDHDVERRSARVFAESFPAFAARYRHRVPDAAFAAAERYGPQLAARYRAWAMAGPHTLSHNDLRLDNILLTDGSPPVVFVDWQRVIRHHGASDLAYFVAGSLTVERRRATEDDLLARYLEGLHTGGVVGYGMDHLRRDYRAAMLRWLGVASTAATLDLANERGVRLVDTMVERHFTAAADHDVAALLD